MVRVSWGKELWQATDHFLIFTFREGCHLWTTLKVSQHPVSVQLGGWQEQNKYGCRSRNITTKLRPYNAIKLQTRNKTTLGMSLWNMLKSSHPPALARARAVISLCMIYKANQRASCTHTMLQEKKKSIYCVLGSGIRQLIRKLTTKGLVLSLWDGELNLIAFDLKLGKWSALTFRFISVASSQMSYIKRETRCETMASDCECFALSEMHFFKFVQ